MSENQQNNQNHQHRGPSGGHSDDEPEEQIDSGSNNYNQLVSQSSQMHDQCPVASQRQLYMSFNLEDENLSRSVYIASRSYNIARSRASRHQDQYDAPQLLNDNSTQYAMPPQHRNAIANAQDDTRQHQRLVGMDQQRQREIDAYRRMHNAANDPNVLSQQIISLNTGQQNVTRHAHDVIQDYLREVRDQNPELQVVNRDDSEPDQDEPLDIYTNDDERLNVISIEAQQRMLMNMLRNLGWNNAIAQQNQHNAQDNNNLGYRFSVWLAMLLGMFVSIFAYICQRCLRSQWTILRPQMVNYMQTINWCKVIFWMCWMTFIIYGDRISPGLYFYTFTGVQVVLRLLFPDQTRFLNALLLLAIAYWTSYCVQLTSNIEDESTYSHRVAAMTYRNIMLRVANIPFAQTVITMLYSRLYESSNRLSMYHPANFTTLEPQLILESWQRRIVYMNDTDHIIQTHPSSSADAWLRNRFLGIVLLFDDIPLDMFADYIIRSLDDAQMFNQLQLIYDNHRGGILPYDHRYCYLSLLLTDSLNRAGLTDRQKELIDMIVEMISQSQGVCYF